MKGNVFPSNAVTRELYISETIDFIVYCYSVELTKLLDVLFSF